MSRTFRRLLPIALVAALGACGPEGTPDEQREAAPEIAPGTESATVPGVLPQDSGNAR